jgi:bacillolysin
MSRLQRLSYHALDDDATAAPATPAAVFRGAAAAEEPESFASDVDAARFYLGALLQRDDRSAMRGLAPAEPAQAEGLELAEERDSPQTETRLVEFRQTHEQIPVFGSRALVELSLHEELIAADCRGADRGAADARRAGAPESRLLQRR